MPRDWAAWLVKTQQKWTPVQKRIQDAPLPAFHFAFAILWNWLDLSNDWQTSLLLISFQRSAVLAGRENLASAVSKANIFGSKWPAFLADLQIALQHDSVAESRTNLSAAFTDRITKVAPQLAQELVRACEQEGCESLAIPCLWIHTLGVDPVEIATRLAAPPTDAAAAWLAGIEAIESDLSQSRIRTMFFLPNKETVTNPSAHEGVE